MRRKRHFVLLVSFFLLPVAGCGNRERTRPPVEPPPADVQPTRIDYTDTDAFDQVLESALLTQDPVILVQTTNEKPDWGDRLNAWIAAWNRGGRVGPGPGKTARGQAPFLPGVDSDTAHEFRLLIEGLMNRIEDKVRERSAWWAQEHIRERRVELLRPYNLRFHLGTDGFIQVIWFNGRYAQYHRDFVRSIADEDPGDGWDRCVSCSRCKRCARRAARTDDESETRSDAP
jgi:hypothetical protein